MKPKRATLSSLRRGDIFVVWGHVFTYLGPVSGGVAVCSGNSTYGRVETFDYNLAVELLSLSMNLSIIEDYKKYCTEYSTGPISGGWLDKEGYAYSIKELISLRDDIDIKFTSYAKGRIDQYIKERKTELFNEWTKE